MLNQARAIVRAKLHNSRVLLQRTKSRRKQQGLQTAIDELAQLLQQIAVADAVESLLGFEGQGANIYFQAFALLLTPPFEFAKRTRRPPTDPVNSLLRLGYTLLAQNIHSMVEVSGLQSQIGLTRTYPVPQAGP